MPRYPQPLGLDPALPSQVAHALERAIDRVSTHLGVLTSLDQDADWWRPLVGAHVILLGRVNGLDPRWHDHAHLLTKVHEVDVDVDVSKRPPDLDPGAGPILSVHPSTIVLHTAQRCGGCGKLFVLDRYITSPLRNSENFGRFRLCRECHTP